MHGLWQAIDSAFSGMNPLDWIIALTLAISTVTAFLRGFIRSLLALAGMFAGILLATLYAQQLGRYLVRWISPVALAKLCAFIMILAAVYVCAMLLGRVLRGACSAVGLGFFDRLAGAAFGFVRGMLLLAAMLLPLAPYLPQFKVTRTSVLLPYLLPAAHGISFVMPRDVEDRTPASHWRTRAGQLAGDALLHTRPQTPAELR